MTTKSETEKELLQARSSNIFWWTILGYPPFDEGKGGFPRTGQVIKYYREKKRDGDHNAWTQKRLADVLDITEKTIGEMENRDATLEFDRRLHVIRLFDIPPILLGIRTQAEIDVILAEHRANAGETPASFPDTWWTELGYPAFEPGKDPLYPRTGQVLKHHRGLKLDDKDKPWTQRLLARTLGLTDQAVWDIENRDIAMDFERRQFLSELFAIPPVLLGIITPEEIFTRLSQERGAKPIISHLSPAGRTSSKFLINVQEYTALLEEYWTTFVSDPVHLCMTNVSSCMDALYRELPHVKEKKQIYVLLCRYHAFVVNVLRDQGKVDEAIAHCQKGLRLAKRGNSDELLALLHYEWGSTCLEADRFEVALQKYEEARQYERRLPQNLIGCLLLDTGCAKAMLAQRSDAKREAMALVDRAGSLVRKSWNDVDPYFLCFNHDRYHLTRALSLIGVSRNRDAISELMLVKAGPECPRRQGRTDIYLAQAHLNLGEYERAVTLAESGLLVVQKIHSQALIARVEKLLQQLKESPHRDGPGVARLEYLLRKR